MLANARPNVSRSALRAALSALPTCTHIPMHACFLSASSHPGDTQHADAGENGVARTSDWGDATHSPAAGSTGRPWQSVRSGVAPPPPPACRRWRRRRPPPPPRSTTFASPRPSPAASRCSQNGYLSSRSGCQHRWHSLVSCDHGDSKTSRFDSPVVPCRGEVSQPAAGAGPPTQSLARPRRGAVDPQHQVAAVQRRRPLLLVEGAERAVVQRIEPQAAHVPAQRPQFVYRRPHD
jgi:hypothetical protein